MVCRKARYAIELIEEYHHEPTYPEKSSSGRLNVQYLTDSAGEKTAVLLPIRDFEALMEDLEDLAAIAERRDEPTISHQKLVAELKRDGRVGDRNSVYR